MPRGVHLEFGKTPDSKLFLLFNRFIPTLLDKKIRSPAPFKGIKKEISDFNPPTETGDTDN